MVLIRPRSLHGRVDEKAEMVTRSSIEKGGLDLVLLGGLPHELEVVTRPTWNKRGFGSAGGP